MGRYISTEILQQRIGSTRLDGLCGATGSGQTAILDGVIARAEALVESYAASRYAVPLQTCDMLVEWALRIAEYELYKRTPGDAIPQKIKDSYEDVLKQLAAMAGGTLKLVSTPPQTPANVGGASVSTARPSGPELFDNSSMRGF